MNRGRHPSKKNSIHTANHNKGEIPITKNIRVIDEQGNEHEATYPKRAKGLVKNGRARFVDENTICLACPPDTNLEENRMTENTVTAVQDNETISNKEIWEQIKKAQDKLSDLSMCMDKIFNLNDLQTDDEEVCCELVEHKIDAMQKMFQTREETLKNLIDFYKMLLVGSVPTNTKTPKSVRQAVFHIMDTEMDDSSKLSAIAALLLSEDAV